MSDPCVPWNSLGQDRIGLITVRYASRRLPGKCLLPLGRKTVLGQVIRRTQSAGLRAIVCTTLAESDDRVAEEALREGAECYRGPSRNKVLRWLQCAERYQFADFHAVDADDPYFDPEEVHASISLLRDRDLHVVEPSSASAAGAATVGYSLKVQALAELIDGTSEDTDTEMLLSRLDLYPGIRRARLPSNPNAPRHLRLTLDYEEDYWLILTVQRILGDDASRADVDNLFARNPDLCEVNWFRNKDWQARQASLALSISSVASEFGVRAP